MHLTHDVGVWSAKIDLQSHSGDLIQDDIDHFGQAATSSITRDSGYTRCCSPESYPKKKMDTT